MKLGTKIILGFVMTNVIYFVLLSVIFFFVQPVRTQSNVLADTLIPALGAADDVRFYVEASGRT